MIALPDDPETPDIDPALVPALAVQVEETSDGHWRWTGPKHQGRPILYDGAKDQHNVRRLLFPRSLGALGRYRRSRATCGVGDCVRPSHLGFPEGSAREPIPRRFLVEIAFPYECAARSPEDIHRALIAYVGLKTRVAEGGGEIVARVKEDRRGAATYATKIGPAGPVYLGRVTGRRDAR